MAMFSSFSIFSTLFLISMSGMVSSRILDDTINVDGLLLSDDGFSPLAPAPQLSPAAKAHNDYLESCADKLTEECGEEMFSYVFENGAAFTKECCGKLVSIGKECHTAMTEYSVELPQYKAGAAVFLARSEQIWNKCSSGSSGKKVKSSDDDFSPLAPSPALSPAAKAHNDYLESCAAKLTEECGEEMFSYVFENSTAYSKECCEKLVLIGKECHAAMTEYSVELPQYKPNAAVFLARSEQIWNKCSPKQLGHVLSEFSPLAPSPALSPAESAYDEYLETCAAKLTETCGEEMFSYVFESGTTYTTDCCKKLVAIGKECHTAMTDYSVKLPQYKPKAAVFVARSEQIWNKCSSTA